MTHPFPTWLREVRSLIARSHYMTPGETHHVITVESTRALDLLERAVTILQYYAHVYPKWHAETYCKQARDFLEELGREKSG